MSEAQAPNFVLYEHAVGYTLFSVNEFEDIGLMLPQVCGLLLSSLSAFLNATSILRCKRQ